MVTQFPATFLRFSTRAEMQPRPASLLAILVAVGLTVLITVLGTPRAGIPALGRLLDPADGLYRQARLTSVQTNPADLRIAGLEDQVNVYIDGRGVPHIYGQHELDVIRAFGYLVARDRLFQMDFIGRVASGRLASLLGDGAVDADRFLRRTGMEIGARLNADRILREDGIERTVIEAFCDGANAYIDALDRASLPFEYRLLGAQPERCTIMTPMRLMQYMAYDLSFRTDDASYGTMRERLADGDFAELFETDGRLYVPIVNDTPSSSIEHRPADIGARVQNKWLDVHRSLEGTSIEGFVHGKGSNNWAVTGSRSTTGAPILAGDMHLSLTLPSIWYEAHLSTPNWNLYGVTAPGAPLPIQSFTDSLGWAFTNTGSDQVDHYALQLDSSRTRYLYDGSYRELDAVIDTIRVLGGRDVVDTMHISHWGPVMMDEDPIAIRWVAHGENRVMEALYGMSFARNLDDFERALENWHAPMQNILYADHAGNIAIRSTGRFPLRHSGSGAGLLDGSNNDGEWVGEIPFNELPHALNPASGFLSSTNQRPTSSSYAHYLGHDWRPGYRSIRINELLRGRARHSVADMKRYQADVVAVQHRLFFPFFDTLTGLSPGATRLQARLRAWDGEASLDRAEPLVLRYLMDDLERLTWDESAFVGGRSPSEDVLWQLLSERPSSKWFNRESTDEREHAGDILRLTIESAAQRLAADFGDDSSAWQWRLYSEVLFRHVTQADPLNALWRGPYEYPGFAETLSPAGGRPVTHSASWRVVLDFSTSPPTAFGIYPGGQSGNPMSPLYDRHIDDYLNFRYYELEMPRDPRDLTDYSIAGRLTFIPTIPD